MRFYLAVAAIVAGAGLLMSADVRPAMIGASSHAGFSLKGEDPEKPGATGGAGGAQRGDDSCQWANDHECDDPAIGTGACQAGTDESDCQRIRDHVEDDSCRWARDGECDEPGFGTNACTQATDRTDCGDVTGLRFRTDSCATAFNGVCEEPTIGNGRCRARTDRRDCVGSRRPLTINDHYFGNDDRIFVDRTASPWRLIGQFHTADGGVCTATLIGPNVLITAAHCIHSDDGSLDASGTFNTAEGYQGGPYEARITGYFIDPNFNFRRFTTSNDIDNMDWALLRIDQPLGDRLGTAGVFNLTALGQDRARATDLYQAGYAWDTAGHLSGHMRCHIATVYRDGTFAHECDTTRGDSGSPFFVREGDRYNVIGVDSNFRENPRGPRLYIAVSASNFQRYVADFTSGRIGHPVGGAQQGDKGKVRRR